MKKFKRLLSTLLVCCLCFGAMPVTGHAAFILDTGSCGPNLTWTLYSDDTMQISGSGEMYDYTEAFGNSIMGAGAIKTVFIQDGVTSIGDRAFDGFHGMTNITIPDSVKSIGYRAFAACQRLTGIDIPNGVEHIGEYAFMGCDSLTEVVIPDSVTSIGENAFEACKNLEYVDISENVTEIKEYTFAQCSSLTSVQIPASVTSIGDYAFMRCEKLIDVVLPSALQSIGVYAFNDCVQLTEITIPGTIDHLADGVFSDCSALSVVTISDGVQSIGAYAFRNCSGLASVVIPKSVTAIGSVSFGGCYALEDVYYGGSESDWNEIDVDRYMDGSDETYKILTRFATLHYNSTGPEGEEEPDDPGEVPEDPDDDPIIPPSGGEDENAITPHTVSFPGSFGATTELTFDWGWELFDRTSTSTYSEDDHRLALAGLTLSAASERSQGSVESALKLLGFESDMVVSMNYDREWYEVMNPGVTFAHKTVNFNGETEHIIAIVLRGTSNAADIITDVSSIVGGFSGSTYNVNTWLEKYIDACSLNRGEITSDNVKFFVTGHSLGGAVANILAQQLAGEYGKENVFAYTFATPPCVTATDVIVRADANIYNFLNMEDIVPTLYTTMKARYGKDIYFSRKGLSAYSEIFSNLTGGKDVESYMNTWNPFRLVDKLMCGHVVDSYMTWMLCQSGNFDVDVRATVTVVQVFCPVDVDVYVEADSGPMLVGRVRDNVVDTEVTKGVAIRVDGDRKYIYLPYEGEYTFQLTGTDDGLMEYSAVEMDLNTEDVLEQKTFSNVSLYSGKEMTSGISVWDKEDSSIDTEDMIDVSDVRLFIVDSEDEIEKEILTDGSEISAPADTPDTPDVPDTPDTPNEPDTPTTPSQPSGGTGTPSYAIIAPTADHGAISVNPSRASYGDSVTITLDPDEGYELETLAVTTAGGDEVEVRSMGDDQYTFTMPRSRVNIEVTFAEIMEPLIFTDVPVDAYYYDAVYWAVENGVTNGTSTTTFSPDADVTRAQMVTFLWRAYGSPQATGSNPFTDVSPSDYYYDAVLWAVENGVTNGTSATTFSPEAAVTRSQAVTFQWRAAGSPATSGSHFDDVTADAYYADAVAWAVTNGITHGTGGNLFSPDVVVSRAQAVTFLFRELA